MTAGLPTGLPTLAVTGIGLLGPGFASWQQGAPLLREPTLWLGGPTPPPVPTSLPPTERRRAGAAVKAALVVCEQAVAAAGIGAAALPTVFTSSTGEPANCHALCEALAAPGRMVSPTRFTNSVHNAPAGYWHIGAQSMQASTSLCAFDASFGAGLLEAAAQCAAHQGPLLLAAFDVPYPEPLHRARTLPDIFGVALVLQAVDDAACEWHDLVPRLTLSLSAASEATACGFAPFEALRRHIPAARALPLLQLLAAGSAGRVVVGMQAGLGLQIDVRRGWASRTSEAGMSPDSPALAA